MAWCMEDLLPWMHMTTDLKIAKDSLHLNQPMRELYGTSRFKDRQQVGKAFVECLCFSSHTT